MKLDKQSTPNSNTTSVQLVASWCPQICQHAELWCMTSTYYCKYFKLQSNSYKGTTFHVNLMAFRISLSSMKSPTCRIPKPTLN